MTNVELAGSHAILSEAKANRILMSHDLVLLAPDHQLGGYRAFAPPEDLAFAVEAAWTHYAVTSDVRHRVVADAAISLC